jgi:hypothetical protein
VSLRPLRPHQERAIAELRRSLASGHKRPMLQAPTGFARRLLPRTLSQARSAMVHEAAGDLVEIGSRTSGKRSATPDEKEQFYARAEMDPGREGP